VSAGASPRVIPQPPPKPLGAHIRQSETIHVLSVESVGPRKVSLKPVAALKGKLEAAPFKKLELMSELSEKEIFRAKEIVLCFREREVATLHTDAGWILAVAPEEWRGEKNWF